MSCFNLEYTQAAENAGSFHPSSKNFRHDERASSHSGSEDGSSYIHYTDIQKADIDPEENPNAGLTSQTLNADGTPKRPMNAFMIFARRRRPQVSAENQSMRTGEISKILSKEWIAMEMVQKQFYLDQAKQLKETFNTRYPDYVYRRRPNNSRKRRRTEVGSNRSLDNPLPMDSADDLLGGVEFGEHSSIEGESEPPTQDNGAVDLHYPRMPHDTSTSYGEHSTFIPNQSRPSAYSYPGSEVTYPQMESHDTRLPYLSSSHERVSQDVPSTTSLEPPRTSDPTHHYPYVPSQGHPPSSPMYPAAGQSSWGERGTTGRVVQSDWLSDQNERPSSSMSTSKSHPQSWPDTTPSISITTNTSTPSHSPNFQFPTLNSPFYPNQPQMQANYQNRSSASSTPSHPSPNPASHYDSVHGEVTGSSQTGRHASYDPHSYARSAPINPLNGYTPGHGAHIYQSQSQSQHSRPIGLSHLAPIPSISTFSHAQAMHPPSTSVGPTGYWPRENMESQ